MWNLAIKNKKQMEVAKIKIRIKELNYFKIRIKEFIGLHLRIRLIVCQILMFRLEISTETVVYSLLLF